MRSKVTVFFFLLLLAMNIEQAMCEWNMLLGLPKEKWGASMAPLGSGNQILLFGGSNGGFDDETYVYDLSESTWTQMFPATSPSARGNHAMAPIGSDQVLLFGGTDGDKNDETWVYDLSENTWTQKSPSTSPCVHW